MRFCVVRPGIRWVAFWWSRTDANRELIAELLVDEGCEVRTARHGMAALEILATWQPGLILLDLRMPGMGGHEFAKQYRELPGPHAPIVLMTASFEGEGETARQLIGAVGVISKPFDLDDLLTIVSQFSPCIS